ncbi:hypothetical protein [Comamonas composti]|uniref:hypothetical protein n=1 Tax=Comamonas composti TaxID=408558 RepID=UPI000405CB50|nr:hypothetical protein [Comamonas composti]
MSTFLALSIVAPHGQNIAWGRKTLEVRSWLPASLPLRNVLIVENRQYLTRERPADPHAQAVALVDIAWAAPWRTDQVQAACSSGWEEGYYAWQLENIRRLPRPVAVHAARKLYELELSLDMSRLVSVLPRSLGAATQLKE